MSPEEQQYLNMLMANGSGDIFASMFPANPKKVGDTNYYQDLMQILADPVLGGISGGMDYNSFQPTFERSPVDAPGAMAWRNWEMADPSTSAMGRIFQLMTTPDPATGRPMDMNNAYNEVATFINDNPASPMARSLPPGETRPMVGENGEPVLNEDGSQRFQTSEGSGMIALYDQLLDVQKMLANDPTGATWDPQSGSFYQEEEVPSAMMEKFRSLGLPSPFEEYPFGDQQDVNLYNSLDDQSAAMARAMTDFSAETQNPTDPRQQVPFLTAAQQSQAEGEDIASANMRAWLDENGPGSAANEMPDRPRYDFSGGRTKGKLGDTFKISDEELMLRIAEGTPTVEGKGGGLDLTDGLTGADFMPIMQGTEGRGPGPRRRKMGEAQGPGPGREDPGRAERYGGQSLRTGPVQGSSRRLQQRALQQMNNQGVRDRRATRMANDPGDRRAIQAMQFAGNRGFKAPPGGSFHTPQAAMEALKVYNNRDRNASPLQDVIRQRMMAAQLGGLY